MTGPQPLASRVNRAVFGRADSVALYAAEDGLTAPEHTALSLVREARRGEPAAGAPLGRVLDIGVGGGRTAAALSSLASRYLGVDYIPAMVAAARSRHPILAFDTADVRAMTQLEDDAFDFALFSFNGLDSLDHEDRLKALAEIRRVLSPGGWFVLSSHNRLTSVPRVWRRDDLAWDRRHLGRSLGLWVSGVVNHLRLRAGQRQTADYAVVNDRAHNHSMLVYYITPERQQRQLADAGFACFAIIDLAGRAIGPADPPPRDAWLHYCCRKTR